LDFNSLKRITDSFNVSDIMLLLEIVVVVCKGKIQPMSKRHIPSGFGSSGFRTKRQKTDAKQAALDLLASFAKDSIVCYTDGACQGNPGPYGSGAHVVFMDPVHSDTMEAYKVGSARGTNNVAELEAVALALEMVEDRTRTDETIKTRPIEILTDSRYVEGLLSKNFRASANVELVARVRRALSEAQSAVASPPGGRRVRVHWVAGHVDTPGNHRADALANSAAAIAARTLAAAAAAASGDDCKE
jgi:ribonuclease HI